MINRQSQTTLISEGNLERSLLQKQEIIEIVEQPPVQPPSKQKRLIALDIYRGLTMVGMILVDNMGPYSPWWLEHTQWNGLTPPDLVFPSFLFIMGMAIPLSVTQKNPLRPKNFIRIFGLFFIGLFLQFSGAKFDIYNFRILGILQRLSICYAVVLIIHFATLYGQHKRRVIGYVSVMAMMLLYLAYMLTFDKPEIGCPLSKNLSQFCNFGAYIDRLIFTKSHMIYPNDPQGLFTNLNSIVTVYIGYLFCLAMKDYKQKTTKTLITWVLISIILGVITYPLTKLMPLNKKIYSISYTTLSATTSGLTLTLFVILIDIIPENRPKFKTVVDFVTQPLLWMGRNPLIVFFMRDTLDNIMGTYIIVNGKSLTDLFYENAFSSWISNKQVCSTVYSCFFTLLFVGLAGILYRFKIFIKL